jgi:two-component system sensor histidine kinase UhpB
MDRSRVGAGTGKWYRRLEVQLWLWAILPVILVLVAITFTGVYAHQQTMRDFVSQRDVAIATLYARQIDDGLAHGTVLLDGGGLEFVIASGTIGQHGVIYVVDSSGRVVYYPGGQYSGDQLASDPAIPAALSQGLGTARGQFLDGVATLASFATVGETQWHVIVEEPISEIIVPVLRFSSIVPVLIVAAVLLSLILIYFSIRTIVRPMQQLADASSRVTWGDYSSLDQGVGGVEEVRRLQGALRDMVDRVRRYQDSMRDYIEAITHGQEAERSRISRELHDETVQNLIAAGQRLQIAEHAVERGDAQSATTTIHDIRELCHGMLGELRRLIRDLRPVYLEDLGFLPALQALAQETSVADRAADFLVRGTPRRLPPEVEMTAYRVVQEALSNAVRHANAQQIAVTVSFTDDELTLSVEDDGTGFELPATPDALTQSSHFGLVGMRERVTLLGGSLKIDTHPGEGTRVTARIPIS